MKRLLPLAVLIAALLIIMGCTTVRYDPIAITNNPIGSKVGEVPVSEGGAYAAAKNGNITKIATVEMRTTSGFMKFEQVFVVTGE